MLRRTLTVVSCTLLLTASAVQIAEARTVYPTVHQVSAAECDYYAVNYARHASLQGELLIGAGLGGITGAVIGSIFAASGVGAAIGAGAGLLIGAAVRLEREEQHYALLYHECMSNRPQVTRVRRQVGWANGY